MKIACILILTGAFSLAITNHIHASEVLNHGTYAKLLSKHVHKGKVDYTGFQNDEKELDKYLNYLARIIPDTLDRNESKAFYINLYNAWTIKLVLSGYPNLGSIKDLGNFLWTPWKKKLVKLNGRKVTLDYIEHDILRPVYKDPRIHFAINCASQSCPPLSPQPYTGKTLDQQLDAATAAFINDPNTNYIKDQALYVSRIFKWFGDDFNNNVIGFFENFASSEFKRELVKKKNTLEVKYLDYDWSLNDI
ncbi:MAG: DUF547 domain-containing protein [Desulfobacteraceae bacterium]|nr:DUF547 domain-containing protein [Desulfobacteraceae bacterium]